NTTALSAKIKEAYLKLGIDFVILVGDENTIPMFYLSTSGSSRTPSDLQYFTMDGAGDNIPDVFYSRLASNDPGGQLQNAMDFEAGRGAPGGFNHVVGIASNEGSNPSDNEYITSIEQKFSTSLGSQASHFYQDSQDSNPVKLNDKLNDGAFWVTYMGHGSGFAWPSMNVSYMTKHIPLLKNKNSVKPVIIDVACQNGRLQSGRLGVAFSTLTPNGQSNAYGAAAYYGGTVDISWHPPAVMAQGIAFEQTDKKFKHLGEALMAGQLYLAAHWNDKKSFTDNLIWYHLQGDPGMDIGF
ncbi:MAG: hypothetical protein KDD38_11305, partial [Bdellovibrionales bacterium]|nr:hypothetical protein [Bdellovibrionales bacterium]